MRSYPGLSLSGDWSERLLICKEVSTCLAYEDIPYAAVVCPALPPCVGILDAVLALERL